MTFAQKLLQKIASIPSFYLCVFLFFLTCVIYINTLGNGLFFDDEDFVYNNAVVKNFSIGEMFSQNLIYGAGKTSNYYRPLLAITYGTEYALFKEIPFIYHLNSFLLQAGACILLFVLMLTLTKNKFIALLVSIIFSIHPIQSEAVAYVSGRGDPLSAVFIFSTLLLYIKGTRKALIFACATLIAAFLSRELGLITPLLLLAVEIFEKKSIVKALLQWKKLLPFFLIASIYFFLRLTILNFENTLNFYGGQTEYTSNLFYRLLTFFSILPNYFGILLFPTALSIERVVEIVKTPLNPFVLMGIVGMSTWGILSYQKIKKYSALFLSFLWFCITILPTTGIIPINGIMYEHFLYFPMIGVFLCIVFIVEKILTQTKSSALHFAILTLLVIFLTYVSIRTISRNNDWHDPITFYKTTILFDSSIARIHNNLAMAYAENGENTSAIAEYKMAISLNDSYPQTHYNLANSYVAVNKTAEAEGEYKKSLVIDPSFLRSYVALAKLYKATNQNEKFGLLIKKLESQKDQPQSLKDFIGELKKL